MGIAAYNRGSAAVIKITHYHLTTDAAGEEVEIEYLLQFAVSFDGIDLVGATVDGIDVDADSVFSAEEMIEFRDIAYEHAADEMLDRFYDAGDRKYDEWKDSQLEGDL